MCHQDLQQPDPALRFPSQSTVLTAMALLHETSDKEPFGFSHALKPVWSSHAAREPSPFGGRVGTNKLLAVLRLMMGLDAFPSRI